MSIVIICVLSLSFFSAFAQTQHPSQEKQRLKDFGSSLKRLKWDEKKKAAVERGSKSKEKRRGDPDEADVVRVETTLVVCDVLVLDSQGRSVRGLNRDDFIVTEDGQPQQVGTFSPGDSAAIPRSIVLVIDYSLNQSGFVGTSIEAAKTLVEGLGPRDRVAIVTDRIELLSDFTDDKGMLKEKLDSLKERPAAGGRTIHPRPFRDSWFHGGAHFSALLATLNEAFDDRDQRPIIIFQANGNEASMLQNSILPHPPLPPDNLPPGMLKEAKEFYQRTKRHEEFISGRREFSLNDVYKAAEKSRATIYTIIPGYRILGLSPDEQLKRVKVWTLRHKLGWSDAMGTKKARQRVMETTPDWMWGWVADCVMEEQSALAILAGITGGWADFLEEPAQAAEVYSRILSDVNRRYLVGYYPSNKEHDGKRRSVKIEVRAHPEYTARGHSSYYAPGPEESLNYNR